MIHVKVFSVCSEGMAAYKRVETIANEWLAEHPEARYIDSHTNIHADDEWTEFSLTLIVKLLPVPQPE